MIYIYNGLMGSGKTDNLLKEYFKVKDDKKNKPLLVKSTFDRQEKFVKSRSGLKALADLSLNKNEIQVIYQYIDKYYYTHVFIDEVQFFDEDIKYLVQNYNRVLFYLSGLEKDYKDNLFGYLYQIKTFPNVKKIYHFYITCQNCNYNVATNCFRIIKNDNQILVGDKEYMSVCKNCYEYLNKGV